MGLISGLFDKLNNLKEGKRIRASVSYHDLTPLFPGSNIPSEGFTQHVHVNFDAMTMTNRKMVKVLGYYWEHKLVPGKDNFKIALRNLAILNENGEIAEWLVRNGDVSSDAKDTLQEKLKREVEDSTTEFNQIHEILWSRYQEYLETRKRRPELWLER